ncbi:MULTISPECIES: FliI/YscN family ATPase [Pseudomonas]|uniref:FliI/YscN family ATPase n=1 Tax=Pseudomonas TaxID=286 RepID=UPI001C80CE37|nr:MULTISPECIES: FliI/YscN family ATPase [Pseudomonas]MDG9930388.1 FliI/YscN family ATPase [Pseudomonas sp. GD04042]MDH0484499.1 FliI/YscN family ATPase [Pseudomonas sp. GD04015]MDH0606043.1 FliI/YscN family ATPase [Pseudomonas sp. GD03869]
MWQRFESLTLSRVAQVDLCRRVGRLTAIQGMVLEATGLDVRLGELVDIMPARGGAVVVAEVVGLRGDQTLLMPHGAVDGLCLSSEVTARGETASIPVGDALLGRVLDATCEPLDDLPLPKGLQRKPRFVAPINPLHRAPIQKALVTGVKAVDVFIPLGRGQRVGIFAGSGVGKSTLLGMMSKYAEADVIVIALIGERGREVGDFIRDSLGPEGLKKAVVIAAAAEQPAVLRRQAAYTATTIAEWFRAQGRHVLLIMDSITRFALAQREIGLATGEPMGSRGYPPSVFSLLPPLMERAGALMGQGSITGVYTVLVEGDDMNEPVADHMRAILDGHIVLSRAIAARGQWPAIDVMHSISRLAGALRDAEQKHTVERICSALGTYQQSADLIELGAYESGSHPVLDRMIALKPKLDDLLKQAPDQHVPVEHSWQAAQGLAQRLSESGHAA